MKQIEYNLLEERWVRVRGQDYTVQEVSLPDALLHAHEYRDLAGELPTQDAAMLRLLLAVLHTVFSRVDENGIPAPFEETDDALTRWEELYRLGHFPEAPIRAYLEQWRDRFWLFHPERPFWQVPEAKIGSPFRAKKLNGEIFESENKDSLFSAYSGEAKERLTYPQAARWLVFLNNYDDTAAKKKAKDRTLPSMGPGWLGRLGVVYVKGANLFDTLMRNLMFLRDGGKLWEEDAPCWELDAARTEERTEVPCPDNFAGLMTMQYRRILLKRQEGWVTGCTVLGGDFFEKEMAYAEQMTVWRKAAGKDSLEYCPRRHDPSRQRGRDFGTIFAKNDGNVHNPGIVMWYHSIAKQMGWGRNTVRKFRIVSVQYGDKDFFVNDTFSDSLTFHAEILLELNLKWQDHILAEIDKCEAVAQNIGLLSANLAKAKGTTPNPGKAKDQFYSLVDQTFREWLRDISPEGGNEEETCKILEKEIQKIARTLADELVSDAGEAAFAGRMVDNQYYAAPEVYNWFLGKMYKIFR